MLALQPHLEFDNLFRRLFSGVGSTLSIRISTFVAYPLQFAFLRLNRLLNAVGRNTSTGLQ